jgi:hypothetical protein
VIGRTAVKGRELQTGNGIKPLPVLTE